MEVNEKTSMLEEVQSAFQSSSDFKYKKYSIEEVTLHLCYLDTLIDSEVIQTHILERIFSKNNSDRIVTTILETEDAYTLDECIQSILSGNVIIFNDNNKSKAKSYSALSDNSDRSISESISETVTLGPHDSFVESLKINSTLIRKRLRTKELIIKNITIGKKYPVTLSIFYLNDLTPISIIETFEQKIKKLESSGKVEPKQMIESVHIQNIIEEYPSSPFPQVMFTERPDRTVRLLLAGRPAIILDNDPSALLFPEESPLLLMMMGQYGSTGNFITKLPKKYEPPYNILAYNIVRPKNKLTVSTSKNKIEVNLKVKVNVSIDGISTMKFLGEEEMWSIINKDLNKRAQEVIKEIQLANSDVLGIGRYLKEHHPEKWRKLNWEKEYPTIKIKPKVVVTILSTGAIGKETQFEE